MPPADLKPSATACKLAADKVTHAHGMCTNVPRVLLPSCCCTSTTHYDHTQEPDELFAAQNTTAHEAIIGVAGDLSLIHI